MAIRVHQKEKTRGAISTRFWETTHPPTPSLTPKREVSVKVGLGEGWVSSMSKSYAAHLALPSHNFFSLKEKLVLTKRWIWWGLVEQYTKIVYFSKKLLKEPFEILRTAKTTGLKNLTRTIICGFLARMTRKVVTIICAQKFLIQQNVLNYRVYATCNDSVMTFRYLSFWE